MAEEWIEKELRRALRPSKGQVTPDFDKTMRAAEARIASGRGAYRVAAGLAAVFALVAIAITLRPGVQTLPDDAFYIDEALLSSTYWESPSDALMPQHRFDIYQTLPAFPGSTESAEGTLL